MNCTVVLVNDGSTDRTLEMLHKLASASPKHIEVLALTSNVGKGEAVRAGFNFAFDKGATQVLFCDADFSVDSTDLIRICNKLDEHVECMVVMGSRISMIGSTIHRSTSRHYAGRVFATFASLLLKHHFYDTQCGAKAFRVNEQVRKALSQPFVSRWAFDIELIGRLLRMKHGTTSPNEIIELPLLKWVEIPGSKLTLLSRFRTVGELLVIRSSLRKWT